MIPPLPAAHTGLLGQHDAKTGKTLRQLLHAVPPGGKISSFQFTGNDTEGPWEISAAYFKPLGWTIAAAVPSNELTGEGTELSHRLAWGFVLALIISLVIARAWLQAKIGRTWGR